MMSSVLLSLKVTHAFVFIKHSLDFEMNVSLSLVDFVKGGLKLQYIMDTMVDDDPHDTCNNLIITPCLNIIVTNNVIK